MESGGRFDAIVADLRNLREKLCRCLPEDLKEHERKLTDAFLERHDLLTSNTVDMETRLVRNLVYSSLHMSNSLNEDLMETLKSLSAIRTEFNERIDQLLIAVHMCNQEMGHANTDYVREISDLRMQLSAQDRRTESMHSTIADYQRQTGGPHAHSASMASTLEENKRLKNDLAKVRRDHHLQGEELISVDLECAELLLKRIEQGLERSNREDHGSAPFVPESDLSEDGDGIDEARHRSKRRRVIEISSDSSDSEGLETYGTTSEEDTTAGPMYRWAVEDLKNGDADTSSINAGVMVRVLQILADPFKGSIWKPFRCWTSQRRKQVAQWRHVDGRAQNKKFACQHCFYMRKPCIKTLEEGVVTLLPVAPTTELTTRDMNYWMRPPPPVEDD